MVDELKYVYTDMFGGKEAKCTLDEYYGQFVTRETTRQVVSAFQADLDAIDIKKDPHLNSIGLGAWDRLTNYLSYNKLLYYQDPSNTKGCLPSLSQLVCIAKVAARQYMENKNDEAVQG